MLDAHTNGNFQALSACWVLKPPFKSFQVLMEATNSFSKLTKGFGAFQRAWSREGRTGPKPPWEHTHNTFQELSSPAGS